MKKVYLVLLISMLFMGCQTFTSFSNTVWHFNNGGILIFSDATWTWIDNADYPFTGKNDFKGTYHYHDNDTIIMNATHFHRQTTNSMDIWFTFDDDEIWTAEIEDTGTSQRIVIQYNDIR